MCSVESSEMFRSFWNHLQPDLKFINKDDDLGQRHIEIVFWFVFLPKQISSKDLSESSLFVR